MLQACGLAVGRPYIPKNRGSVGFINLFSSEDDKLANVRSMGHPPARWTVDLRQVTGIGGWLFEESWGWGVLLALTSCLHPAVDYGLMVRQSWPKNLPSVIGPADWSTSHAMSVIVEGRHSYTRVIVYANCSNGYRLLLIRGPLPLQLADFKPYRSVPYQTSFRKGIISTYLISDAIRDSYVLT